MCTSDVISGNFENGYDVIPLILKTKMTSRVFVLVTSYPANWKTDMVSRICVISDVISGNFKNGCDVTITNISDVIPVFEIT